MSSQPTKGSGGLNSISSFFQNIIAQGQQKISQISVRQQKDSTVKSDAKIHGSLIKPFEEGVVSTSRKTHLASVQFQPVKYKLILNKIFPAVYKGHVEKQTKAQSARLEQAAQKQTQVAHKLVEAYNAPDKKLYLDPTHLSASFSLNPQAKQEFTLFQTILNKPEQKFDTSGIALDVRMALFKENLTKLNGMSDDLFNKCVIAGLKGEGHQVDLSNLSAEDQKIVRQFMSQLAPPTGNTNHLNAAPSLQQALNNRAAEASQTEGVFRLSGRDAEVKQLLIKIKHGRFSSEDLSNIDIHTLTGVVKQNLGAMELFKEGSADFLAMTKAWLEYSVAKNMSDTDPEKEIKMRAGVAKMKEVLNQLPKEKREALKEFVKFANNSVISQEVTTKMAAGQMGIVLGPILFPTSSTMSLSEAAHFSAFTNPIATFLLQHQELFE